MSDIKRIIQENDIASMKQMTFKGFWKRLVSKYHIGESNMLREIYGLSLILKNLAVISSNKEMNGDYIISSLLEASSKLKGILALVLKEMRKGKINEDEILNLCPTRECREFMSIIIKVDVIEPRVLANSIEVFMEKVEGQMLTKALELEERKSLIVTLLSTSSIFALVINFAIVVVLYEGLSMLGNVF